MYNAGNILIRRCNMRTEKVFRIVLTTIFAWVFLIAAPYLDTKYSIPFMSSKTYAGDLPATDLSEPDPAMKLVWSRTAGREDAVYLDIPSNQINDKVILPHDPNPIILAKYDESTATATLAVMRMRQVGFTIQAGIFRITPKDFQHYFGPHLYQFAFLNWKGGDSCDYGQKYLHDQDPPDVDNNYIISSYNKYDLEYNIQYDVPTTTDPTLLIKIRTGSQQYKVNRSNFYWHQRLNDDPCWEHVALRQFDQNNGMFNNISHFAFLKLVALAQHIHKAPVAFIATPKIRPAVETSTKKSAFRKKVTTTVRYWLSPEWTVSTIKAFPNMQSDYEINTTWDSRGTYSFVKVQGNHSFPVDETLIYEWSETKSGWTGFFVLVASVVIGAALGAYFGPAIIGGIQTGALAGGGLGAIGGLIASGFSPTTNTTAQLTPFSYSAYQLDPSSSMSGDAKAIADRTRSNWVMPDAQNTPGGVQRFIMKLDMRKILRAGSVSATNNVSDDTSSSVEVVRGDDPRFNTIYNEMFYNPSKTLQKYKYPYEHNTNTVPVPTPVN
jgi:hypothetical protein